jgi:hypothetical protein
VGVDEFLKSDNLIKALMAILGSMSFYIWNSKPSKAELEDSMSLLRKEFDDKLTATVNAVVTADAVHDKLQIEAMQATIGGLKDLINQGHETLREDIRDLRRDMSSE